MSQDMLMVVGSLNREVPYFQGARGVGLSVLAFDPRTGRADLICEERGVDNPTFLSVDPGRLCVYATSEVAGWHEGIVSAYRYDPAARRLRYVNKQPSLGSVAAHSSLDAAGRRLLVANYGAGEHDEGPDRGVAVFPLRHDGGLGAPAAGIAHRGRGHDALRQERAHPHCVVPSPDGRFVAVVDLGLDAVVTYGYGPGGDLAEAPASTLALQPGTGPRHLAFHPEGRLAVLICELDPRVALLAYDAGTGAFAPRHAVPAVPETARQDTHCSDVQVHPGGRFVYAANRGHDSILVLAIDAERERLEPVGHQGCGGRTPRHLQIDPSGRFLVVANQNSDRLSVFAIDPERGTLAAAAEVAVGTPMCVRFMPAG